jgi:hypothetical protein
MYLIRAGGAALVLKGYAATHLRIFGAHGFADMRRNRQKSFVVIIYSAQLRGFAANSAPESLNKPRAPRRCAM